MVFFFLKPDLIPKLHLLKPKTLLSILVTIMVVAMFIVGKGKGNVQWPKNVGSHHYSSFFSIWVYLHKHSRFTGQQGKGQAIFPVDTGRKLNIHKTFRRRPGRLLNVLCTFNLRPVSTESLTRHGGQTFLDKVYGEVTLNGKTNNQIILRWGRCFMIDKCNFQ